VACGGFGFGAVTVGFGLCGGVDVEPWLRRPRRERPCDVPWEREWCRAVVPTPPDVPLPEEIWVAAPIPNEAPTAPTMPSEAIPVWSRLLR
jgi:hypothetical protein